MINDPIYGFVSIDHDLLLRVLDCIYFQRLRSIQQLSVAHFVFPGATHTRFQHCLGAFYLVTEAIAALRKKGVHITEEESLATRVAVLLHDVGHTSLSHVLEKTLLGDTSHETVSACLMEIIEQECFSAATDRDIFVLARRIFSGQYEKTFLCQLICSQVDVDRMDYLNRDSFYTGVAQGKIGYSRILQTLHVHENQFLIEDKGIYAVEQFLIARYFMYWQVYVHKNVWALGQFVQRIFERVRVLLRDSDTLPVPPLIHQLLTHPFDPTCRTHIDAIVGLDDCDVWVWLKQLSVCRDPILQWLLRCLFDRHHYRVEVLAANQVEENDSLFERRKQHIQTRLGIAKKDLYYFVFQKYIRIHLYEADKGGMRVLFRDGSVHPLRHTYHSLLSYRAPENTGKVYQVSPRIV